MHKLDEVEYRFSCEAFSSSSFGSGKYRHRSDGGETAGVGMSTKKRDWKRIKGFRDPLPRVPVIYRGTYEDANGRVIAECVLVHGKRKFSFWCSQPLEEATSWSKVHGMVVDDRLLPELPHGFEKLRPLRKPDRHVSYQAKQTAFAVLKEVRAKEHFRRTQPSLFPED